MDFGIRGFIILLLLTAGVLPAVAQSTASNVYVFPLFVDGTAGATSFRSTLKITNTSGSTPLQCSFVQRNTSATFTGVDGDFYTADVFDAGFSPPALTLITLDKFLPFILHNSFVFETRNIREAGRMLTNEDLKRIRWDPESIDWADYWVNIHTKGIEKWIRPVFTRQK